MAMIGYARVSTSEQNTDSQCAELTKAGCGTIFIDEETGTKFTGTELEKALIYLREGDVLVVTDIDRLRRNTFGFLRFIDQLEKRGVKFKSLYQNTIDTTTPNGKFMSIMYAAFAELEASLISQKTKRGLREARARGRFGGRPQIFTDKMLTTAKIMYNDQRLSMADVAEFLGVSKSTIFKYLNADKNKSCISSTGL